MNIYNKNPFLTFSPWARGGLQVFRNPANLIHKLLGNVRFLGRCFTIFIRCSEMALAQETQLLGNFERSIVELELENKKTSIPGELNMCLILIDSFHTKNNNIMLKTTAAIY